MKVHLVNDTFVLVPSQMLTAPPSDAEFLVKLHPKKTTESLGFAMYTASYAPPSNPSNTESETKFIVSLHCQRTMIQACF